MKDSGSREPLHFLLFSTSLLSKPNEDPAALQNAVGSSFVPDLIMLIHVPECMVMYSKIAFAC